ncbi:accessory gene regulator B family protein [Paenibacillus tyrfis]|uniref:accessory gene regulator B family protein n=1 Tax=Paenibacillus tyrfis TaxID=1501230 RepID=UPI00137761E4
MITDPIEKLAELLAIKAKSWDESIEFDVDEIRYGLSVRIAFALVIISTLLIGFLSERVVETTLTIFSFWLLRNLTGGFHLKSLTLCVVVSVILLSIIPHIQISPLILPYIGLLTLVIVIFFSENRDFKSLSLTFMIVFSSIFFSNSSISLSLFSQSLTLIKIGRWKSTC